jgi:glycosyltransferase involved in cell wall biosynthesis
MAMITTPKVSFVLPTYNYAQYLRTCVGSILAQDYEFLEVVIVDDASSDDTPLVAEGG